MSNSPTDLAKDMEVDSRASRKRKRVRSSICEECNSFSKRKRFVLEHVTNLPKDLANEVLSRVPVTSVRKVRSTCKTCKTLFRSNSFTKKHIALTLERELMNMMVMITASKISLISINLDEGELISLYHEDRVRVSQVFHCDGLLLCRGVNRLELWNPFLGQTLRIDLKPSLHHLMHYSYAIGYDRSTHSHKILRFVNFLSPHTNDNLVDFNIYDLNSNSGGSWRVLDFGSSLFWKIDDHNSGVSLKGDTYWFARESGPGVGSFLICFDFTRERFGPRLPLPPPVNWRHQDTLTLSSVREEQLGLLFQREDTLMLEIWITTKIDPNAVSWSPKFFLQADMIPHTGYQFPFEEASFYIDEEKEVAVVFDKDKPDIMNPTRNVAYILGVDTSMTKVDLGESPHFFVFPRVCNYVPSLRSPTPT